jgi:hypothetical protein
LDTQAGHAGCGPLIPYQSCGNGRACPAIRVSPAPACCRKAGKSANIRRRFSRSEFSGAPKQMEILMAVCVLFECPGVTQAQYDEALKKVTGGRAGNALADWSAPGLLSHVAGPTPNGWRVVDVWASEADLMKFAGVLMPILKSLGFPDITPEIIPAHNFVKN